MFAPLGNATTLPPITWHPEPQFRGTFSILSSCLITMSLCIWTSLHLNLPEYKRQNSQKYRKLGWMVVGLLAPELVVWNAWEQRKDVKRLSALMKSEGFMPEKPSLRARTHSWIAKTWQDIQVFLLLKAKAWPKPRPEERYHGHMHAWTDVHSWLVVMGGLAFEDLSHEDQQFMPEGRRRTPITLTMFEWLVTRRPHLIPDLSREFVEDKGKSDWLAKGLTCWQASYFCIQCIFRLSQHLAITLLELNVFAHAICAILIFFLWWDKPQDVSEPHPIRNDEALDICACDLMNNSHTIGSVGKRWSLYDGKKAEVFFYVVLDTNPKDTCLDIDQPRSFTACNRFNSGAASRIPEPELVLGAKKHALLKVRETYWRLEQTTDRYHEFMITLTSRDITRLVRVYEAVKLDLTLYEQLMVRNQYSRQKRNERISNLTVTPNDMLGIFPFGDFKPSFWMLVSITFAGALYGGLHLIAWSSTFPSRPESLLWRAASVTILSTGPICAGTAFVLSTSRPDPLHTRHRWSKLWHYVLYTTAGVLFLPVVAITPFFMLWYGLCRTFIVVECFILLAHIPETALHVPTWAAYIPSFS